MLRPVLPVDTPQLLALAEGTGVFRPIEIQALREVLDDYHAAEQAHGHRCVLCERDGRILGFVYHACASMTDGTWYVFWIAVERQCQGHGVGSELLSRAEDDARRANGRILLIETSSLPAYEATHKFYRKHGCEIISTLHDYYTDGDDMLVFGKRLRERTT